MRIYAVLDLKGGQVVHGVAGQRDRYRPIASCLTDSSSPAAVARAFVDSCAIRDAYVADLDAIAGEPPDLAALAAIAAAGMRIIVDAGIGTLRQAQPLLDFDDAHAALSGIVVGLESTADQRQWPALVEAHRQPAICAESRFERWSSAHRGPFSGRLGAMGDCRTGLVGRFPPPGRAGSAERGNAARAEHSGTLSHVAGPATVVRVDLGRWRAGSRGFAGTRAGWLPCARWSLPPCIKGRGEGGSSCVLASGCGLSRRLDGGGSAWGRSVGRLLQTVLQKREKRLGSASCRTGCQYYVRSVKTAI